MKLKKNKFKKINKESLKKRNYKIKNNLVVEKEERSEIGIQNNWDLKGILKTRAFKLTQTLRKKNRLTRKINSNKILPFEILAISSLISPLPLPILDFMDLAVSGK